MGDTDMTEQEMKDWIDKASLVELLQKWRFAPSGDPFMQGEVGTHFSNTMFALRDKDNDAWVSASKQVG